MSGSAITLALLLAAAGGGAQATVAQSIEVRNLSAADIFVLADKAYEQGRTNDARALLTALFDDPDPPIRREARFRLGILLSALGRHAEAAVQFRTILDEQPNAQPVRLELARVLALMGDMSSAARELRAARAGELPPEVAQIVDRFSAALRAQKPYGASVQIALAPDSNINRATRSDTLGTIIGDFTLSDDAKARSGIGLSVDGQAFARTDIDKRSRLLARVSAAGDFYGGSAFNDVSLGVQAGPEVTSGRDRINLSGGPSWRWFGGRHYTTVVSSQLDFAHPLSPTSQLRARAGVGFIDNRRNALESGESYSFSLGYERALSNRAGVSVNLVAIRQDLRDPGYSTTSGQISLGGYREIGRMTVAGSIGYSRLEADRRLFLYPHRRVDDQYPINLGTTFRQLTVAGFAPIVQLTAERNRSSVELYDYSRLAAEFGITRAF